MSIKLHLVVVGLGVVTAFLTTPGDKVFAQRNPGTFPACVTSVGGTTIPGPPQIDDTTTPGTRTVTVNFSVVYSCADEMVNNCVGICVLAQLMASPCDDGVCGRVGDSSTASSSAGGCANTIEYSNYFACSPLQRFSAYQLNLYTSLAPCPSYSSSLMPTKTVQFSGLATPTDCN